MIDLGFPEKPRITGTEMEWGLMVKRSGSSQYEAGMNSNAVLQINSPENLTMLGQFYSNGSRIYIDTGNHLEYATPECSDFRQTVAAEIAGESVTHQILSRAQESGWITDFTLNKRVVDVKSNTWGYHENYLTDTGTLTVQAGELALLGIHLATRNIYTGAGMIGHSGSYHVAQKVINLNIDSSMTSHQVSQPLLSLRDEPLAEGTQKRIHVTSGDANISPWATWMKLGTTSLVLRLMEHEVGLPETEPLMPIHQVAKQVGFDPTLSKTIELRNGTKIKPSELQWKLFELAKQLGVRIELPLEEYEVLEEWERALTDLDKNPDLLIDRADWVLRRHIIREFKDKYGVMAWDKKLKAKDLQYDKIGHKGIGLALRDKLWQEWMPDAIEIDQLSVEGPRTTRAYTRGRAIGALSIKNVSDVVVGWDLIKVEGAAYRMGMPRQTYFPDIEKMIDRYQK